MREVPGAPGALTLPIDRSWDGAAVPGGTGLVAALTATPEAMVVVAEGPVHAAALAPDAPPGTRVDRLWTFDVVECFFRASDGRYLELELGVAGHYLALRFSGPRELDDALAQPPIECRLEVREGRWRHEARVPRHWFPEPIDAIAAFAIEAGRHYAADPVGGAVPDFHRTHAYRAARIPSWESSRAQR